MPRSLRLRYAEVANRRIEPRGSDAEIVLEGHVHGLVERQPPYLRLLRGHRGGESEYYRDYKHPPSHHIHLAQHVYVY